MKENIKLDTKNLALLRELEKDSRTPISKIAKRIKVSKEVAHYRLNKLIESGLIKEFDLIVDYFSLGYKCYRLVINLQNLKYDIRKDIIDDLKNFKKIDLNVYLSSDMDLELNVWVRYSNEFYDFYNYLINKYSEYINDKELYLVTKIHIASHGYLHNGNNVIKLGEDKTVQEIDDIDEKLIEILEKNPREDIVEVSKEIKIPISTIHYRIKQLKEKKIIKGTIPIFDKSVIGYNTYKVEIVLKDPQQKKEFVNYLAAQLQVTKITEIIGNKDLDFYADFKTTHELDAFLEQLRLKVPQIKDFEVVNIVT